jgi:hypothetical protein
MSQYRRIDDFGPKGLDINPLTYCMEKSTANKMQYGGSESLHGTASKNCQAFMSERCSKNWDGNCEYYYNERNERVPNSLNTCRDHDFNMTSGVILLKNTADRKFCDKGNCQKVVEQFDTLVTGSPNVTYYMNCRGGGKCSVDASKIDIDPVMNRCLQNPGACDDTLYKICKNGKKLGGTKIGKYCEEIKR